MSDSKILAGIVFFIQTSITYILLCMKIGEVIVLLISLVVAYFISWMDVFSEYSKKEVWERPMLINAILQSNKWNKYCIGFVTWPIMIVSCTESKRHAVIDIVLRVIISASLQIAIICTFNIENFIVSILVFMIIYGAILASGLLLKNKIAK